MNRITKQKCNDWGWLYAPDIKRAEIMANGQDHDHALVLSGPIDARNGIESDIVLKAICAEIATATAKLQMDTCGYPKNRENPHLNQLNCTCDNITINPAIIFETIYRAKDHALNGQPTYAVMLTGKRKPNAIKHEDYI